MDINFSSTLSKGSISNIETQQSNASKIDINQKKEIKKDFLNLLVKNLQHQDPLNPTKDQEFISQMTQFFSLDEIVQLGSQVSTLNKKVDSIDIRGLLGKNIMFTTYSGTRESGVVESVEKNDNEYTLKVKNYSVYPKDVISVK